MPISITVDTHTRTAVRDDGGKPYTVMKLTPYAVWLLVDDPENVSGTALQMIQRGRASTPYADLDAGRPYKAGKWVDVVISMTGMVSPIAVGMCWERP